MATTTLSNRVSEFIQALASLVSVFIFLTGINSVPEWLASQYNPPYYDLTDNVSFPFSSYWYALPYYLSIPIFIICLLLAFGAFFIFTFKACKWLHGLGLISSIENVVYRDEYTPRRYWRKGTLVVDASPTNDYVIGFFVMLGIAVAVLAIVPFVNFPSPDAFQSDSLSDEVELFAWAGFIFVSLTLVFVASTVDAIVKVVGRLPGTRVEDAT